MIYHFNYVAPNCINIIYTYVNLQGTYTTSSIYVSGLCGLQIYEEELVPMALYMLVHVVKVINWFS